MDRLPGSRFGGPGPFAFDGQLSYCGAMARLPITITKRREIGICISFADGLEAWIYAKEDPHTARIARQPTIAEAEERAKEIARALTEAWRGS
jgi:hypothetical protein